MRRGWWRAAAVAMAALVVLSSAAGCVIHRREAYTPTNVTARIAGTLSVQPFERGDPAGDQAWRTFPYSGVPDLPFDHAAMAEVSVDISLDIAYQQCNAIIFLRHPTTWLVSGVSQNWALGDVAGVADAFGSQLPDLTGVQNIGFTVMQLSYAMETTLADRERVLWQVPEHADLSQLSVAVGVLCGARSDDPGGFVWLTNPVVVPTATVVLDPSTGGVVVVTQSPTGVG